MAKRFTDTALNRQPWFRKLSPKLKCATRFLFDECDNAGVWVIDMEILSFFVGEAVTIDELFLNINSDKENRIEKFGGDKIFIPGFIGFQYGELSEKCKPHKPIIALLKKYGLFERVSKGYPKGMDTLEEKEKEKEKEIKEGVMGETKPEPDAPLPILHQMLNLWTIANKDYRVDQEVDLAALRKIAVFITQKNGLEHLADGERGSLLATWRSWCTHILQSTVLQDKSLSTIAKFKTQEIHQQLKNPSYATPVTGFTKMERAMGSMLPQIDPEPYLLTPEEEDRAIQYEIDYQKSIAIWKMRKTRMPEEEIHYRVNNMDWLAIVCTMPMLQRANAAKNADLWRRQCDARRKEEAAEKAARIAREWDYKRMYRHMKSTSLQVYGKKLIVHDDNLPLIKALCFFMAADPRFETELGYSLQKGLLIRGVSGLGKTHLVKCLAGNERAPIKVYSMLQITQEVKAEGGFNIEPGECRKVYLDDVGTEEPEVKHYGTVINWFKDFLETYYLKELPFNRLMISTNNSFDELEANYGFRVRSRIKDMFNWITVDGIDMRG